MSNKIETYGQKRKKFRGGYLLGDIVFLIVFIARSAMEITGKTAGTLWTVLNAVMVLSILWMIYFTTRLVIVVREIRRDPLLKEALNNELDRLNELKSWRVGFFSLIFFNLIALYVFHVMAVPLKEPVILLIISLLVGFGSFDIARYVLDR
jgi:hypothetical protein